MKNVILLTIDALRKDVLGCYGNTRELSPFIDSVAEDGLVFTHSYCVAPYTQASFPGILTSSYLFDYPRSDKISPQRTLISESLQRADIPAAAFHSNPYLSAYFGWNRGWKHFYDSMQDDVDPQNPYIKGNVINQKVEAWLDSYLHSSPEHPFFMWVHYMDMHEPYVPDPGYIEAVDASVHISNDEMFALFKENMLGRDTSNPEVVDLLKKLYLAHVREVDDYTRMLFDILDSRKLLKDTVVIITSDHGEEFNEHGGLSHDGKMYSELIRTPLVVCNYDTGKSVVCDKLVSAIDIAPTIVNLFELDPEPNFQGRSFLPVDRFSEKGCFGEAVGKLSHKIKPTDKPAYFYCEKNLIIFYREEDDKWELYDLQADPGEVNNIIETSPRAATMKEKLKPRIGRNTKNSV
jgi:arylsulfatase A-like enzyme